MNETVDLAGREDVSQTLSASLVDLHSKCSVKVSARGGPEF